MKKNQEQMTLHPHPLTQSEEQYLFEQIIKIFTENGVQAELTGFFQLKVADNHKIPIALVNIDPSSPEERMDLDFDLFEKEIGYYYRDEPFHDYTLNIGSVIKWISERNS